MKNNININNIIQNEDLSLNKENKTYHYEENNNLEKNELNIEEEEAEDLDKDIDEEDRIVTNIVPKIYGASKIKTKNQSNEEK